MALMVASLTGRISMSARQSHRFPICHCRLLGLLLWYLLIQSSGAFIPSQRQSRVISAVFTLGASISSEEVRSRLVTQLDKLREKDRQAKVVSKNVRIFEYMYLFYM